MSASLPPSQHPPPADSRKLAVVVGVSVACLVYAASLVAQRKVPELKAWLGISLTGDIKPTYYLRSGVSLVAGATAGLVAPRGPRSERNLAWFVAIAVAIAAVLIVAFP
jgi:hypothetical protein